MKTMTKFYDKIDKYQKINVEQKGITFTEEEFTQLWDDAAGATVSELSLTLKGVAIGATAVCGIIGGKIGWDYYKKRRLREKNVKVDPKVLENVKLANDEVSTDGKVKELSKADKKELEELVSTVTTPRSRKTK